MPRLATAQVETPVIRPDSGSDSIRRVTGKLDEPRIAVAGSGYWGRNLVRVLAELGALAAVHDPDQERAAEIAGAFGVPTPNWDQVLGDPSVDAVAIAAPAALHGRLAADVLAAGKDVFVEKPLALELSEAEALCRAADDAGRVLMVGHLLHYHNAFRELSRLVDRGALGKVQYVYSHRLSFGRIRREENILWSFAPHDISMILRLVGEDPVRVEAVGSWHLSDTIADVTTTHLAFPGGVRGHIFVSWLHPYKEHRLVVVGDEAMAVFDDSRDWPEKLVLYPHRVELDGEIPVAVQAEGQPVLVEPREPLNEELRHFLTCLRTRSTPLTNGREGLRVLRVLDDAQRSLLRNR